MTPNPANIRLVGIETCLLAIAIRGDARRRFTMTAVTRSLRVFNSVFPPDESPFLSGFVRTEQLRPDQQRHWDVVTRIIQPHFSSEIQEPIDLTAGRMTDGDADY